MTENKIKLEELATFLRVGRFKKGTPKFSQSSLSVWRIMVKFCRVFCMAFCLVALLLAGCGNRDTNPVGGNLVGRESSRVVELPLLPATDQRSRFGGIVPLFFGVSAESMVGRMNGLIFRSLFRFQVKADSLARAGGGAGVTDLIVTSAQVHLVQRSILKRGVGELTVHRPDAVWTESTIFADTLTFVEVAFPFSPIAGATTTTVLDTTILVDLPGDYVQAALVANPQLADVEFLLAPGGSEEFITGMITRNGATPGTEQYPVMTLNYTVKGTSYTDSIRIWEDTFYGGRYNGGPGPGQLLLSSGIRYGALFRFAFPDSIPKGATVAGAELQLTANPEKSVFVGFPFGVDRVEVAVTAGDTTFTRFNTWLAAESSGSFLLNQSLVQGWVSGAVPNLGLALRPRNDAVINWLLLDPPRLKLTYSIPPPLENSGSAP